MQRGGDGEDRRDQTKKKEIKEVKEVKVPRHLTPCRHLSKYRILNHIDEGTYGIVYRAESVEDGKVYALKKVKFNKGVEGFPIYSLREIRILTTLRHRNIVVAEEVVYHDRDLYIVMEYLDHNLRDLMDQKKEPFTPSEVKTLLMQLLRGVAYLHRNWVMHRDIKTSNILLNNEGNLKLADFGLARHFGDPLDKFTRVVVTLWYRPPELLLGASVYSEALDMWSIGCVFAELLANKPLFPARNELDALERMFTILGPPSEAIWEGSERLVREKQINVGRFDRCNSLHLHVNIHTQNEFDLLNRMLCYDPKRRISAEESLNHPYFLESPQPKDEFLMPTFRSIHERSAKMRRRDEERPQEAVHKIEPSKRRRRGIFD